MSEGQEYMLLLPQTIPPESDPVERKDLSTQIVKTASRLFDNEVQQSEDAQWTVSFQFVREATQLLGGKKKSSKAETIYATNQFKDQVSSVPMSTSFIATQLERKITAVSRHESGYSERASLSFTPDGHQIVVKSDGKRPEGFPGPGESYIAGGHNLESLKPNQFFTFLERIGQLIDDKERLETKTA